MATKQQKHQNLVDSLCSAPENAPAGKKWCADLSGYDWVKILNANPASQLVSLCHWDKLNGNDWTKLLSAHPDFAVYCSNWDLLSGNNWAELLVSQPSLAEHCRWDSLYDGNWAELLRHRPQFAEHCRLDRLSGNGWSVFLRIHPEYADQCKWQEFNSRNWTDLLRSKPQFIDRCPCNMISGDHLGDLLGRQPQLHTWFPDWEKMNPISIALLLARHPEIATEERLALLDATAWTVLLRHVPEMAEYCDWKKFNSTHWMSVFSHDPHLIRFWNPADLNANDRRYALETFYDTVFCSGKNHWDCKCMLNELASLSKKFGVGDFCPVKSMFNLCDKNESAEAFVMLSTMDPRGAAHFLGGKIQQERWDMVRRIVKLQPALIPGLFDHKKLVPYFIMNAPEDLALYAIQETGSFAGEYTDSCKCNCFHALFYRIANTDPFWFVTPPKTITRLYTALLDAGCDPDAGNLQHFSYHSMEQKVKENILFYAEHEKISEKNEKC